MKNFIKRGISTLPVVNEILFFVLLAHEVVEIAKNCYKEHKSSKEKTPENELEKK